MYLNTSRHFSPVLHNSNTNFPIYLHGKHKAGKKKRKTV